MLLVWHDTFRVKQSFESGLDNNLCSGCQSGQISLGVAAMGQHARPQADQPIVRRSGAFSYWLQVGAEGKGCCKLQHSQWLI
eukprot:3884740-Amphidinium_carterae.1